MSNRTLSRAANSIERKLDELAENFDLNDYLECVGFSKPCYERAYELDLETLGEIQQHTSEELKEIYDYDLSRLQTLERNISKIYNDPYSYLDELEESEEYDEEEHEEIGSVDEILEGWENVQEYDEDYLEAMADWEYSRGFESKRIIDVNGFKYECDSEIERKLIRRLQKDNYFKELRGQNLVIDYKKRKRTKKYCPDIVLLNKDNHIVLIEAKPLYNMSTNLNLKKYRALSNYCEENGYLYCMCDEDYRNKDILKNMEIDEKTKDLFKYYLDMDSEFNYYHYECLKKDLNYLDENYIKENIAAIVIQCRLSFSKGDLAGHIRSLKIYKRRNSLL